MRKLLIVLGIALALAACGDRAKELYETAQFEERQFNRTHAVELYREIVQKHPRSPYAAPARERLAALEQGGSEAVK
jgi:hypothetical protein